ncbi:MAG: flagellar motor switch protein FliN [Verrucomicrobium sp.]|nr:flagellar motor switch protein FliN [Verrucomicrobium sp.]
MNDKNVDLVMDIMVGLSVELGRAQMKVRDIVALTSGTVVQLDKKVDENVDLYVNGKLIGRGEVVMVDESLGIKITEVFKQATQPR